jgi:hypothetical protein
VAKVLMTSNVCQPVGLLWVQLKILSLTWLPVLLLVPQSSFGLIFVMGILACLIFLTIRHALKHPLPMRNKTAGLLTHRVCSHFA